MSKGPSILDPCPLQNGKPPGFEACEGVARGRSAQGVVMTGNDDCSAPFISTHQTPGRFAPAWELHSGKANAKLRSESLKPLGPVWAEGIDDEWSG